MSDITNSRPFYTLVIGAAFNLVVDGGVNPNHSYIKTSKHDAEKYVKGVLKKTVQVAGAKLVVTESPEFASLKWDNEKELDRGEFFCDIPIGTEFYRRSGTARYVKIAPSYCRQTKGRYIDRRIEIRDSTIVIRIEPRKKA